MFKEKLFSLFNKDSIFAELTLLFTMVILPSKEDKLFFWSTNKSSIFTLIVEFNFSNLFKRLLLEFPFNNFFIEELKSNLEPVNV